MTNQTDTTPDPYVVWLNIREPQRPLNAYQILGLAPLESDPTRIRSGYDRQKASLDTFSQQADPEQWNRVCREIDQALAVLSDPERKAVLDAAIRRSNGKPKNLKPASDAAATAGAAVTCRACQRANPAGRRYCSGCGQPLWQQCPNCHAECAAEERFCGACGTDIAAGLEEHERNFKSRIDEALALAAAYQYDAAISALRGVAATPDARFQRWAEMALAEVDRIEREREAMLAAADEALEAAQRFFEANAYDRAQAALVEVPEALRTSSHTALLDRAKACRQEVLLLSGEIRDAVKEKRN